MRPHGRAAHLKISKGPIARQGHMTVRWAIVGAVIGAILGSVITAGSLL